MEREKLINNSREILDKCEHESEPYTWKMGELEFVVYPGVFSPKYFRDTEYFAKVLPMSKGQNFLEMGCGTGVISIMAALNGASVTALDINPIAVKNTQHNARIHNVNQAMTIKESNLFTALEEASRFDVIFWNVPFCCVPEDTEHSILEKSILDPEYKTLEKFVCESKKFLAESGTLCIGFSSTIGDMKSLELILNKYGFEYSVYAETTNSLEGTPISFELIKASNKS